jgi:hypothetical protein
MKRFIQIDCDSWVSIEKIIAVEEEQNDLIIFTVGEVQNKYQVGKSFRKGVLGLLESEIPEPETWKRNHPIYGETMLLNSEKGLADDMHRATGGIV